MKKVFKIDYELAETIFKDSDKFWNKNNLKLHKCSEETPNKPGAYIAYEQYDLNDQYLVVWNGGKWIHFEYGDDIGFGSKDREDHWSELPDLKDKNPCSKIKLPRSLYTCTNVIYQLHDLENTIRTINPEIHTFDRTKVISEETENAYHVFKFLLFKDLGKLKK